MSHLRFEAFCNAATAAVNACACPALAAAVSALHDAFRLSL
jgi:hypothetical protein